MTTRTPLQAGAAATVPPERRGVGRDQVRMLVSRPGTTVHSRFDQIGQFLDPGDLVVVNNSPTRKAAIGAQVHGAQVVAHLATRLANGQWLVELRLSDGSGPMLGVEQGAIVDINGMEIVRLDRPFDERGRLWHATALTPVPLETLMERHARPIRYSYLAAELPIDDYQTIFALPGQGGGSAEMPSAARPFSWRIVTDLVRRGIVLAPITLHTGISSQEAGESPHPEWYEVSAATAALVDLTRAHGGRVIAVGTTVTRALESVARPDGGMVARSGWTELVIGPGRPVRVVDGLLTGWHPPEASHLELLRQVAGEATVAGAYQAAASRGYLWHEFGDVCLFLPD